MMPSLEEAQEAINRATLDRHTAILNTLRQVKIACMHETGMLGGPNLMHPTIRDLIFKEAMAIAGHVDIAPAGGPQQ